MTRLCALCATLAVLVTWCPAPASAQVTQYVAILTGEQEVPPVESQAFSAAFFTFQRLRGEERLITVRINFGELTSPPTAAHIHNAAAGVNGAIVLDYSLGVVVASRFLNVNVNEADDLSGPFEGQTLQDLREAVDAGNTYVNVHTEMHPTGEIRGQIMPNNGPPTPADQERRPAAGSASSGGRR
jgi:hypothetical protein